jgi:hypothetical protein
MTKIQQMKDAEIPVIQNTKQVTYIQNTKQFKTNGGLKWMF